VIPLENIKAGSLRIAGSSYVPRAQSSFLKKNPSRWVLRVLLLPSGRDQGGSYTGRSLPSKQLYKIRSSSGVSKDKGTASLRPFNMLVRKANVAPLVALPRCDRARQMHDLCGVHVGLALSAATRAIDGTFSRIPRVYFFIDGNN